MPGALGLHEVSLVIRLLHRCEVVETAGELGDSERRFVGSLGRLVKPESQPFLRSAQQGQGLSGYQRRSNDLLNTAIEACDEFPELTINGTDGSDGTLAQLIDNPVSRPGIERHALYSTRHRIQLVLAAC